MAAFRGNVLSRSVIAFLPRFSSSVCRHQTVLHRNIVCSASCTRLSFVRGAASTPSSTQRGLAYSSQVKGKQLVDEDEVDYSDEDSDTLDALRRQHRKEVRKVHATSDSVQFADFGLNEKVVRQLDSLGYKEPFAIQAKTLEHTLNGRDVIGKAVTGSGKTMAFSIPIVHKLLESGINKHRSTNPKAIVISPTRELCMQIYRSIQELNSHIRCVAVYGGDSFSRQENTIKRGVDVVCATPGRLRDHLSVGTLGLHNLEFLCLDEADELLTPNFKEQIEDVLENSPKSKQMMLFSATMPPDIKRITRQYMNAPEYVDITAEQRTHVPENIKHLCINLSESQYLVAANHLIKEHNAERCIVFMETKVKTTNAARVLRRHGLKAEALNSDLTQFKREKIMSAFRTGQIQVLVATDVAARGLDVPECDLVIQAGVPRNGVEYYIHRAGRTGRAGRDGVAVLLYASDDVSTSIIRQISRLVKLQHKSLDSLNLNEALMTNIVSRLQRKSRGVSEKSMEIVKRLNLSTEDTEKMLASAIDTLVKIDQGSTSSSSSSGFMKFSSDNKRPRQGSFSYDNGRPRQESFSYDNGRPRQESFMYDNYRPRSGSFTNRRYNDNNMNSGYDHRRKKYALIDEEDDEH